MGAGAAHRPAAVLPGAARVADLQHQRHPQGLRLHRRPDQRRARQCDHAFDALHVPDLVFLQRLRVRRVHRDAAHRDLPAGDRRAVPLVPDRPDSEHRMTTTVGRDQIRDRRVAAGRPPVPPGKKIRSFGRRLPARVLLLVLLVIEIYPFVWLFLGSVKSQGDHLTRSTLSLPTHWMWGNYRTAWVTGQLGTYIRNSLLVTLPSLVVIAV